MAIRVATDALLNNANDLIGKIVFTYVGSPWPANLAYLSQCYKIDSVKGTQRLVPTHLNGKKVSDKQFISPRSIGLVCDTEEEAEHIKALIKDIAEKRFNLVASSIAAVQALCEDEPVIVARVRERKRPSKE